MATEAEHDAAHTMTLVRTHETGAEEWLCPTCGRWFVMQWPPQYKRIILDVGNDKVRHTTSRGGLRFVGVEVSHTATSDAADLSVWADCIDQLDFDAFAKTKDDDDSSIAPIW